MVPLPSTDTSFPYITVQAPSRDEEYQKLKHFRSSDCQLLTDEPVEYHRLNRSLPGTNSIETVEGYATPPGQVSRCNKNTDLVHNISSGQFTQCYNNKHCYMFSIFCSL